MDPESNQTVQRGASSPGHWHYISFGLSDLYGDGRIHEKSTHENRSMNGPSGFGHELTFRLANDDETPPMWPVRLLQCVARFIYRTQSTICAGDHVVLTTPLIANEDNANRCIVKHLLIMRDLKLGDIETPFGKVQFLQIIGISQTELSLLQSSNGQYLCDLLSAHSATGGWLCVTDMHRLEVTASSDVTAMTDRPNCSLSGVTCFVTWRHLLDFTAENMHEHDATAYECDNDATPLARMPGSTDTLMELLPTLSYTDGVHLLLSDKARTVFSETVLPHRLRRHHHFTFLHPKSEQAVSFVPGGVDGSLVNANDPIVAKGHWLQIFAGEDLLNEMEKLFSQSFQENQQLSQMAFHALKLKISFLPDESQLLSTPPSLLPTL